MADYGKLAADAKAKAIESDAVDSKKVNDVRRLVEFFKSVEINLGLEINSANPELLKQGLLIGPSLSGIVMKAHPNSIIELSFGYVSSCKVILDLDATQIRARLTGKPNDKGFIEEHELAYLLESGDSEVKAHKIDLLPEMDKRFGAKEIAEVLVTGMIQGSFD